MKPFVLSIDQGTTGSTASLFDRSGLIASHSLDFRQIFPKPGWVEHDPLDIWQSVKTCVIEVLRKAQALGEQIQAIGITNQRETVLVWKRSNSEPIHNAIVWQCRRTTEFCQKIKKHEPWIKQKTGLVVDPYFSASKIRWILDHVKGARQMAESGELATGTIDCFLLWKLTNAMEHQTDVTNASRTQLMNVVSGDWDEKLLKLFRVPNSLLPAIRPTSFSFGVTQSLDFLPDGIPITAMIGDQQSALFGQNCFEPGDAKCTFGTGSFLLINAGKKFRASRSGALTTIAWQLGSKAPLIYAIEGSAFVAGAAVQWLRDQLKMIERSEDIESLASQVSSTEGVEFVPAFTGLGAPYWRADARAVITGLSRGSERAHIARACLEGIALQNCDLLAALSKDAAHRTRQLKVDGGAAANNLLMQLQADFLGVEIHRPKNLESTSAGAAFMAGLHVGFWKSLDDIKRVQTLDRKFKPTLKPSQRKARLKLWHEAVKKA